MLAIMTAATRAVSSLRLPKIWMYLLTPAVLSLALWIVVAFAWLGDLIRALMASFPLSVLVDWGWPALAGFIAAVGAWLLLLALAYLSATVLAAIFVVPWLLDHVAARDYPQLARRGADSAWASTLNTLKATLIFVSGGLLTLPLWLIPGVALVLPALWLAYLNRATFAYDALAVHATADEWREIRRREGGGLFSVGLIAALLAHVPILGLLVPTLAALMYVHYGLDALARLRQTHSAAGTVIDGEVVDAGQGGA